MYRYSEICTKKVWSIAWVSAPRLEFLKIQCPILYLPVILNKRTWICLIDIVGLWNVHASCRPHYCRYGIFFENGSYFQTTITMSKQKMYNFYTIGHVLLMLHLLFSQVMSLERLKYRDFQEYPWILLISLLFISENCELMNAIVTRMNIIYMIMRYVVLMDVCECRQTCIIYMENEGQDTVMFEQYISWLVFLFILWFCFHPCNILFHWKVGPHGLCIFWGHLGPPNNIINFYMLSSHSQQLCFVGWWDKWAWSGEPHNFFNLMIGWSDACKSLGS